MMYISIPGILITQRMCRCMLYGTPQYEVILLYGGAWARRDGILHRLTEGVRHDILLGPILRIGEVPGE